MALSARQLTSAWEVKAKIHDSIEKPYGRVAVNLWLRGPRFPIAYPDYTFLSCFVYRLQRIPSWCSLCSEAPHLKSTPRINHRSSLNIYLKSNFVDIAVLK